MIALSCYQNICSASFRFVTIHAYDRQTDGRTDTRTDRNTTPKTALAYACAVKMMGLVELKKTSMALYPSHSSNLEQLALNGLTFLTCTGYLHITRAGSLTLLQYSSRKYTYIHKTKRSKKQKYSSDKRTRWQWNHSSLLKIAGRGRRRYILIEYQ